MDKEPFELDELGWCYFAALIDGLRLINEKERDSGITVKSSDIAAGLVDYVVVKGKQIARAWHMAEEREEQQGRHHVRWSLVEIDLVAKEARRLFPVTDHFTLSHFQQAQMVLPEARRKKARFWGAAMMEQLAKLVPAPVTVAPMADAPSRPTPSQTVDKLLADFPFDGGAPLGRMAKVLEQLLTMIQAGNGRCEIKLEFWAAKNG